MNDERYDERDNALAAGLRRAIALDEDELAFLRAAALPQRLVALAASRRSPLALAAELLWVVVPVAVGYAGWLLAAPVLLDWFALARQAGLAALLASIVTRALWGTMDLFASVVEGASALPGFDAPLATIALLAAATYVIVASAPLVIRRPVAV